MTCLHEEIKTWYFEDTNQPAGMWSCKSCGHNFFPLKLWVGLTEKDKDELVESLPDFYSVEDVIAAVAAKLKEKNA